MAFLAQLRCEELAAALPDSDVPRDGLLVVFAAVDKYEGEIFGDAIHVELIQTTGLKRRPWPRGLPHRARSRVAHVFPVVHLWTFSDADCQSAWNGPSRARNDRVSDGFVR